MTENEQWYYTSVGQQVGPIDISALIDMIVRGGLDGSTMVWKAGMPSWAPITSVAELAGYVVRRAPQAPPSPVAPSRAYEPAPSRANETRRAVSLDNDHGKTLCRLSIVFGAIAFLFLPPFIGGAGLICGIVGVVKSKDKTLGTIGIIVSALGIVVGMIIGAMIAAM